jgi:hypothetical protein
LYCFTPACWPGVVAPPAFSALRQPPKNTTTARTEAVANAVEMCARIRFTCQFTLV